MIDRPTHSGHVDNSLLHRQATNISDKGPDEGFRETGVVEIENVLDDVVSEWVLDEVERVEDDLSDELKSLRRRGVVDRALQHAASVSVSGHFDEVGSDGIVDELVVLGDKLVQALLNDLDRASASRGRNGGMEL